MTIDEFSHLSDQASDEGQALSMADFDQAAYLPYLDEFEITDEQKTEYLQIIWEIARFFVQTDIPAETWGQILDPLTNPPTADSDELDSSLT